MAHEAYDGVRPLTPAQDAQLIEERQRLGRQPWERDRPLHPGVAAGNQQGSIDLPDPQTRRTTSAAIDPRYLQSAQALRLGPVKAAGFEQAAQALMAELAQTEAVFEQVRSRLGPVLRPTAPTPAGNGPGRESQGAQLLDLLALVTDRLTHLRMQLAAIDQSLVL